MCGIPLWEIPPTTKSIGLEIFRWSICSYADDNFVKLKRVNLFRNNGEMDLGVAHRVCILVGDFAGIFVLAFQLVKWLVHLVRFLVQSFQI